MASGTWTLVVLSSSSPTIHRIRVEGEKLDFAGSPRAPGDGRVTREAALPPLEGFEEMNVAAQHSKLLDHGPDRAAVQVAVEGPQVGPQPPHRDPGLPHLVGVCAGPDALLVRAQVLHLDGDGEADEVGYGRVGRELRRKRGIPLGLRRGGGGPAFNQLHPPPAPGPSP